MAKYTCLADGSWVSPAESSGSIQCYVGIIEISSENVENTGVRICQGDIVAFSGTVYVRSVAERDSIFTTVPFDWRGGGGGGGGGVPYTLPTASATIKGGIKVGNGLDINSSTAVLNVVLTDYASGKDYIVGNVVKYNGDIYECVNAHTSTATFNPSDWNKLNSGGGGDAVLTENVTANKAAGAIAINDVVAKDTTFTEFVKQLLIAEIAPTTTFNATNSGLVKKGDSVTTVLSLTISSVGTGTPVSIVFMEGTTVLDTQPYVAGTNTYTYTPSGTITTTTTFKGVLDYTKSDGTSSTVTKDKTFTFVDPVYYGAVSTAPATGADVIAVGNATAANSRGRTVNYNLSNNKSCYCYPTSLGALTSIKDANNFEYLSSYDRSTVTVGTVPYYVYTLSSPVTLTGFKQVFA